MRVLLRFFLRFLVHEAFELLLLALELADYILEFTEVDLFRHLILLAPHGAFSLSIDGK